MENTEIPRSPHCLSPLDIHAVLRRLPRPLRKVMEAQPGLVLAGGALRSIITREPINDFDLFVSPDADAAGLANKLVLAYGLKSPGDISADLTHVTPNAITIRCKPRVQIITRWRFETPSKAIASFDFTIAQACVWFDRGGTMQSACCPTYYQDLSARRLVYTSPIRDEEPGGSMLRLLKLTARGYRADLHSVARVVERLTHNVDPQGGAHRLAPAQVIAARLREVDPLAFGDWSRDTVVEDVVSAEDPDDV